MPSTTPRRTPRPPFRRPALVELERRDVPAAYTVSVGGDVTTGFAANSLRGVLTSLAGSTDATNSINFALGATTITLANRLPVITKSVTVTGQGAASTTVSGNGAFRVFDIAGSGTIAVGLSDLTLTKGKDQFGGAVRVADESLTFTNCVLSDSTADNGGLVAAGKGAAVTFVGCALTGGVGNENGGAVGLEGPTTVAFVGSTLSGNTAALGGAVDFDAGSLTADQTTFSGNSAVGQKGDGGGGAIALGGGATVALRNSTFTSNAAGTGGGGAILHVGPATTTLTSTIVAGNTATGAGPDVNVKGGVVNATVSLIGVAGAGAGFTLTTDTGNQKGTTAAPLDPLLGPLANNGGRVQTRLPLAGSPTIDKGSNPLGGLTDARGAGYPRELPTGLPDVGAVEGVPPTIAVTTLADAVADDGLLSLREAIGLANLAADANTITFGLSGTVTLTSALPTITASVAVAGAGKLVTVNGNGQYRPFDIDAATGVIAVAFSDVTITGGAAGTGEGGAVRAAADSVTFTSCTLSNSTAVNGGLVSAYSGVATLAFTTCTLAGGAASNLGGAVFLRNAANVSVVNSTLSGNTAGYGGGAVYFDLGGSLTASQATFSGNRAAASAPGGWGGAISLYGASAVIRNSTFTGNSAGTNGGGAIRQFSTSTTTLASTIVAGNTATGTGPDIYNPSGTVNATSSLIGVAGAGSGLTLAIDTGNQKGITAAPLNPQLGPLANNGGRVQTHLPLVGSPVLDEGSNAQAVTTDARGAGYPREVPTGLPDVGAVELQDRAAPTVSGAFGSVTTRKGTAYQFAVRLADNVAVSAATVQGADFTVTGPNGYSQAATLVGLSPGGNPSAVTVTLTVTPPGGAWDATDNGTYTVSLTGAVQDTTGNAAVPAAIGTFGVSAPVGVLAADAKLADGTVTPLSKAGQRSVIPAIRVTFDGPATGAQLAASYSLVNTATNTAVAFGVTAATVNGRTVATLTPAGGGLANGYYALTLFGTAIGTAGGGGALDGDNNGSAGGNYGLSFHRFAGDVTGDTAVDGDDLAFLAQAFNSVDGDSNYRAYLDLDGDGAIDGNDLAIFAQSFALGVL